jgi:lipopolysaccharide/colanic/teichoic acid biosynthesis glycosyltransferase
MRRGKRIFDLVCAIPGTALLLPVFLLLALAIKLEGRGPVFFRQDRVGRGGRLFRIWKFRTMVVGAERFGGPLTVGDDHRITRVGRWLRRFKLDELPQLFNVGRGEMSLVGPRPEVPKYVSLYTTTQRKVLELTPGITDPASVAFREESNLLAKASDPERAYVSVIMPAKIQLNLEYAARATVWRDFVVVLQTLWAMVGTGFPVRSAGQVGGRTGLSRLRGRALRREGRDRGVADGAASPRLGRD